MPGMVRGFDRYQREHSWIGLPLAVAYKFAEDQAMYLAALIAYYGFLAVFPLLLLLVSVLGFLLHNDPDFQERVVNSALHQFPVIGDQIGENIRSFHGNSLAVVTGVLGGLYGALGVAQAAQNALLKVWAVPRHRRPNPLMSRLRSLLVLGVFGAGLAVTTGLTALAGDTRAFGAHPAVLLRVVATVLSTGVNTGLLLFAYRYFTADTVKLRVSAGAGLGAAVAWQLVQWAGTYYVRHELRGATATYGLFGIVLGLLTWIYLGALLFVLAAEVASVRSRHLWPRSLLTPFTDNVVLTPADRAVYVSYAATDVFKGFQHVTVRFDPPDKNSDR
ncbi:YihY/virulence factor BrkB family protein [Actinacidiphila alni]|uniref:YihY/virulence factor BrkB family protein n=1 Tax=Actinacidiphila alni TaxID=380248 RepID=UPI00345408CF